VLAGLLHRIGVLRPAARNLIPYALELYKPHYTRIKDDKKREEASRVAGEFRDALCWPGRAEISFLGLWDTVKAFGLFWPRSLPHIRHNPDVGIVRHALALDERRRSYVPTSWGGLDDYVEELAPSGQDVKEIWFAGSHSDVGGGHCEEESGLSWFSFKWLIDEARKCSPELRFEKDKIADMLRSGITIRPQVDLDKRYWKVHQSRTALWWFVDQIPRPELTNAPPRSANQREHLKPGLSVPVGWPKHSFLRAFWPTTGHRHIEQFKRGGKVLIHKSVQALVQSGKYPLKVDNLNPIVEDEDEDVAQRGAGEGRRK